MRHRGSDKTGARKPASMTLLMGLALAVGPLWKSSAPAYIDPSTGGTLLQFLLGGLVAGALMTIRLFWRRVASTLGFKRRDNADDSESPPRAD